MKKDVPPGRSAKPAAAQRATLPASQGESLAEACSYEVVQSVQEQLCELMEEHKESREEEPLTIY